MSGSTTRIIVKSRPDRLRRAGMEFTREGVVIDTATIGAERLAAIKAEPLLIVGGEAPPVEKKPPAPHAPAKAGRK